MRKRWYGTLSLAGLAATFWLATGYVGAQNSPVGTARMLINMPVLQSTTGLVSSFSFLNLGPNDANLNITVTSPEGVPIDLAGANPASASVRAGQQFTGTAAQIYNLASWNRAGWVQGSGDQGSVLGLTLVGDAQRFDVVPAGRGDGSTLIVTSVEWNDTYATELHYVNLDSASRRVTFYLRNADGADTATATVTMPPHGSQVKRLDELFQPLANPFSGYILVRGATDLALAALLVSNAAVAALPAVVQGPTSADGARLYAAHFATGGPAAAARLTLVNPTYRDAALLIRALADDGSTLASTAELTLRPGQMYQQEAGRIFNFDSNTLVQGALAVESSIEGVLGDINYFDPSGSNRFRASMPLVPALLRSLVIPYVANDATFNMRVSLFNPGNTKATVQMKIMGAAGTISATPSLTIPAGGRVARALSDLLPPNVTQTGGYITLDSDQPIAAAAVIGMGAQGDFAVLGAQASRTDTVASAAAIDASPASLDFGSQAVGSSRDLPLTLRNFGTAALTVNSIAISNDKFTFTAPSTPFQVAPGGQQALSVRFSPVASGMQNGALTVASNDPNRPNLTIPLTGAGTTAGGPAISTSTNTLDFGGVSLGQSADQGFTVRNTGTGILTINSITADNPVYTVKSPVTPVSVGANVAVAVTLTFRPTAGGAQNATLTIASNDAGRPSVTLALTGSGISTGSAAHVAVSPFVLDFGSVVAGQSKELQLRVGNTGGTALSVSSITSSDARFTVSPGGPFSVDPGQQQVVTVRFLASLADTFAGTLTIASNDPARPSLGVSLSARSLVVTTLFSDSFNRADADKCSLGTADQAAGGTNPMTYVPLFSTFDGVTISPIGADLVSNALQNDSYDYGGVIFSRNETICPDGMGFGIGQDINIRVDLIVPTNKEATTISQAGPFFRSRLALAGDSILGANSAGYWVMLHSTGEVKVKRLNPVATVAASGKPASFDTRSWHTLEVAVQGATLQVALDGKLLLFNQDGNLSSTVSIPSVWDGPPAIGVNQGGAGLAFGDENNHLLITGQRARNLLVTTFRPISDLPVQSNFR